MDRKTRGTSWQIKKWLFTAGLDFFYYREFTKIEISFKEICFIIVK
jgi:hypothetical protein